MTDYKPKTKEELEDLYNESVINAARSGSIEQLRFYQGQIALVEKLLGIAPDAFAEEEKHE